MALDWGILHWIQNNISCPFLDAVVPKLTMLGNAASSGSSQAFSCCAQKNTAVRARSC